MSDLLRDVREAVPYSGTDVSAYNAKPRRAGLLPPPCRAATTAAPGRLHRRAGLRFSRKACTLI